MLTAFTAASITDHKGLPVIVPTITAKVAVKFDSSCIAAEEHLEAG